jgi:hypothetical protein
MAAFLEAQLTVRPRQSGRREEFVALVSLGNRGDETVSVNLAPVESPSLALEIVDAAGAPALLPPPPVPRSSATRVRLAPGERHALEYRGFVPQWFAPGNYRVRFRYRYRPATPERDEWTGELSSEWREFTITK